MAESNSDYNVAFGAVILAAAAFLVTFLQTMLQYVSSSNSRHKCSTAAIGRAHKLVNWHWSFTSWRLKVKYPLLDFNHVSVMREFYRQSHQTLKSEPEMRTIINKRKGWGWRSRQTGDRVGFWHITDLMSVLVDYSSDSNEIVSWGKLTFKEKLWFLYYKSKHPLRTTRQPRASWAQLLTILRIDNAATMSLEEADADTIPTSLDVPIQRIQLRDLGYLAFVLGFTTVVIDPSNRYFRASSPFGTISTEEVQILGKLLRFDGDALKIHQNTSRCDAFWLFRGSRLIFGQFTVGRYTLNGIFSPIDRLHYAISSDLSSEEYDALEVNHGVAPVGSDRRAGAILQESMHMRKLCDESAKSFLENLISCKSEEDNDILRRWKYQFRYSPSDTTLQDLLLQSQWTKDKDRVELVILKWQEEFQKRVPTVFAAASFVNLHGVICGYPARSLLYPFSWWFEHRAKFVHDHHESSFVVSKTALQAVIHGKLSWARETSHLLMSTDVGKTLGGVYGWGVSSMEELFLGCPIELQQEFIIRDGDDVDVNIILVPETVDLLESFHPNDWIGVIEAKQAATRIRYRALNLLWIQVLFLDISIQFLIRSGWTPSRLVAPTEFRGQRAKMGNLDDDFIWSVDDAGVIGAITQAWNLPSADHDDDDAEKKRDSGQDQSSTVAGEGDSPTEHKQEQPPPEQAVQDKEKIPAVVVEEGTEPSIKDGDEKLKGEIHAFEREFEAEASPGETSSARTEAGKSTAGTSSSGTRTTPWEWDLVESLEKHSGLTFGTNDMAKRRAKFRKLALLLELRALFMIAFLWTHPDSTDVFVLESAGIEMPMV
ncbi:MAG: hypothetical protein M1825_001910 [Sarcosagium campestre]|nr:MAG: hypothetical protein M1825_001910 [Sarcosagium campestre]